MQYRNIGQTGLRVSEIGFGCGNNAVLMVKAPYEDQVKAVRRALDAGINFFDTAFAYGLGKSEENLGRILKDLGANPVISTKIRLEADAVSDVKAATVRAVEAGLKLASAGIVSILSNSTLALRSNGARTNASVSRRRTCWVPTASSTDSKPCAIAAKPDSSDLAAWAIPRLCTSWSTAASFMGFNATTICSIPSAGQPVPSDFSALDYGLILDRAAAKGMGAFVIRVLAAGALTSDPSTGGGGSGQTLSPGSDYPLDLQRAEKVKTALGVDGKDLTQAAIRFGLMNSKVSVVLVGFSNPTHVDEAVACSGAPGLSDEQMARVRKLWETDFKE